MPVDSGAAAGVVQCIPAGDRSLMSASEIFVCRTCSVSCKIALRRVDSSGRVGRERIFKNSTTSWAGVAAGFWYEEPSSEDGVCVPTVQLELATEAKERGGPGVEQDGDSGELT